MQKNAEEFSNFLKILKELKCITWYEVHPYTAKQDFSVSLKFEGWQRYYELQRNPPKSNRVFVAMAHDNRSVYENAIQPAIKECGYDSYCVNYLEHNEDITDKIFAGIRGSKFIVADFTSQRNGVYFEAGFAMGLNIPVIWTCKEDEKDKLHFDTNHRNHILWKSENELREKLINRIDATIIR
jgi:nucleoside 2-deoxyribosyltransferase